MTAPVIFDDIVKVRDVQEFNSLVRRYLEDQNIKDPEERRRRAPGPRLNGDFQHFMQKLAYLRKC